MFCCCFLFILTISVKPILKNLAYQTDLVQIVLVGRTMSVDDQSEISFFSILQGTLPRQPIFGGFIHRTDFRYTSG